MIETGAGSVIALMRPRTAVLPKPLLCPARAGARAGDTKGPVYTSLARKAHRLAGPRHLKLINSCETSGLWAFAA